MSKNDLYRTEHPNEKAPAVAEEPKKEEEKPTEYPVYDFKDKKEKETKPEPAPEAKKDEKKKEESPKPAEPKKDEQAFEGQSEAKKDSQDNFKFAASHGDPK